MSCTRWRGSWSGPIARTGCWSARRCLRRRCIGLAISLLHEPLGGPGEEFAGQQRGGSAEPLSRSSIGSGRMELPVTRLQEGAQLPSRAHEGDAGLDLYACEAAHIGPGERWGVGTGVGVEIPEGHAGLVLPRSGLARDHGIALVNAPGLIDSGYRGELRVLLLNTDRAAAFGIAAGDRIAQLVVVPVQTVSIVE